MITVSGADCAIRCVFTYLSRRMSNLAGGYEPGNGTWNGCFSALRIGIQAAVELLLMLCQKDCYFVNGLSLSSH